MKSSLSTSLPASIFIVMAVMMVTACDGTTRSAPSAPKNQAEQNSDQLAATQPNDAIATEKGAVKVEMPAIGPVLDAVLAVHVKINTWKICDGTIDISLNPEADDTADLMALRNLQIKCIMSAITDPMLKKLDIAKMLEPLRGVKMNRDTIEVKDDMMAMVRINDTVFTPARGMLPLFLSDTDDQLRNFGVKREHIQFKNVKSNEEGELDSETEVLSVGEAVYSTNLKHNFTQTIKTEVRTLNANTTRAFSNMLPDSMTIVLSMAPIVILNFNLKVTVDKITGEIGGKDGTPPSLLESIFNGLKDSALIKGITSKFNFVIETEVQSMKGVDQGVLDGPKKRNAAEVMTGSDDAGTN